MPVRPLKKLTKGMGLYQVFYWQQQAPDKSKPWAVVNLQTRTVNGRWHATKNEAAAQAKALYVKLGNKARYGMAEPNTILSLIEFSEQKDDLLWIEALPAKTWHTKEFGEVDVTVDHLQRMVDNFYGNVRGQEVPTNYNHGMDRAKGDKASGWIREAEIRDESLWLGVKPTPVAEQELKNNEWKYFSLEWDDFTHPETQQTYQDVIYGGGFTNTPIAKGMVPINFSELFEVTPKEFASKTPYGNVTYADPGYQADKVKRYPLDVEKRIRAAWSYINMPKNAAKYSSGQVAQIKSRIKAAMGRIGAKVQMSEESIEKELNNNLMTDEEAVAVIEDEHAAEEHKEPGEQADDSLNPDDAFPDRHVTLPEDNDNNNLETNSKETEVDDKKLREILGLDEKADIIKAVTDLTEEVGPLREVAKQFSEKKKFAEDYPEQAAQLERSIKRDREFDAKQFSEKYGDKKFGENKGLSALALEKIGAAHKAFSEGTVTLADFEAVLDTLSDKDGLIEFNERGSSRVDLDEVNRTEAPSRMAFSEKVKQIAENDKLDFDRAIEVAAERYPELYEAYRSPVRA